MVTGNKNWTGLEGLNSNSKYRFTFLLFMFVFLSPTIQLCLFQIFGSESTYVLFEV